MKKILLSLLSLVLSLSLCGCWDRREIGEIAIVMGFAVDSTENEDEIEITAQIANTRTIAAASESGGSGGGEQKPYLNLSASAEYVFPAIRSSITKSGSKLYMSHNYVILFGQELAERGLEKYMDFFLRDHELRLDMPLLVARGQGADVLDADTGFQSIPALHINDLISTQKQLSTGMTVTILDFMDRLSADRGAPMIPIMEIKEEKEKQTLHLSGTAVFDNDTMIGELDEQQTRGCLWASGKVNEAVIMTEVGDDKIGIEVSQSSGGIKAETDDSGNTTMVLSVHARGDIGSVRGSEDYTTKEGVDILLKAFAGEIEEEIRSCLEKSRELKADVFGFSDILYRYHPKLWDQMQDAEFHNLPVRIEVETKLDSSGRLGQPIH
ncbi:MAG: Ger(x)C family spore germination protein [Ruminococcaceae bacterium]|nr:Ger(x)C family spore germination protein [Oscillospiraceae bacterium]